MSEEDNLLARLNALKPSSVTSLSKSKALSPDPEDELVNRFLRVRSVSPQAETPKPGETDPADPENGETVPNEEDNRTLKELLADVPSASEWTVDAGDERNIEKLIAEAQKHIPTEDSDQEARIKNGGDESKEGKHEDSESHKEEEPSDDALADEYLQQILDELDINDTTGDTKDEPGTAKDSAIDHDRQIPADQQEDEPMALPSAPSNEPEPLPSPGLSLPSAPSAAPTARKPAKSSLPKHTDAEIETWCIICCDDASVKCLGCDGDLYCGNCWREGHTGPDSGYAERTHKAVRFVKPKDEEKAQAAAA
jgi:hypothetical protein